MVTTAADGSILSSDEVSSELFGYEAPELVGKNLGALMDDSGSVLAKGMQALLGSGLELRGRGKSGRIFPIWLSVVEVKVAGSSVFVAALSDLSQQKSSDADLATSSELTRGILETAVTPIITIDAHGIIHSFNPAAERLFGYASSEVLGRTINRLMPEPMASAHDGYLRRHLETGEKRIIGRGRDVVGLKRDGRQFPLHLSVGALQIGTEKMFVGIIADMTEKNAVDLELRRYRDHLEELVALATIEVKAIIKTAVNGIVTSDEDGRIRLFNPAAEAIFGWESEEVIGKNVSLLMAEPDARHHSAAMARYTKSGTGRFVGVGREVIALRRDGTTFPAHIALGHSELSTGRHLFVAFIADISLEKRAEEELKLAKSSAEAAAQAKSAFQANKSHEIRTPMNAIIGFAELLLAKPHMPPEERARHTETILSSGRNLLGIINNVLDFSKGEAGKFTLEQARFHLANAVRDALRTLQLKSEEKKLALDLRVDASVPTRVIGDPTRLRQIVLNLVGNAIKFTDRGGVTVEIRSADEPEFLHFSVKDTGIGMAPEQVGRVFESFTQADASTTRRFGGTGLGAAISQQLVHLMGGHIWIDSAPGVGSTFHFTVRLPAGDGEGHCLFDELTPIPKEFVSPRCFRVLLAEDIEANATLAILRIQQAGHTVTWVKNGRDAVQLSLERSFDVILMDVQMPELDGLSATRQIRARELATRAHTPVIALTASIMHEEKSDCFAAGMDAVVGKPIDFSELFVVMERFVAPGRGAPNVVGVVTLDAAPAIDFTPVREVADIDRGLSTWRDPLVYARALGSFARERTETAAHLRPLLGPDAPDLEAARTIAHALKGLAGNLALTDVARLAVELDGAIHAGARATALRLTDALDTALTRAGAAIAQLTLPAPSLASQDSAVDMGAAHDLIKKLNAALDQLSPDAAEPIVRTLGQIFGPGNLASVQRCLDAFDFEAAKRQTRSLAVRVGLPLDDA
jgi:two-component system sensor histidine kinase EvgS